METLLLIADPSKFLSQGVGNRDIWCFALNKLLIPRMAVGLKNT